MSKQLESLMAIFAVMRQKFEQFMARLMPLVSQGFESFTKYVSSLVEQFRNAFSRKAKPEQAVPVQEEPAQIDPLLAQRAEDLVNNVAPGPEVKELGNPLAETAAALMMNKKVSSILNIDVSDPDAEERMLRVISYDVLRTPL